ncbi:putative transcriptional regulator [Clostridium saccharoperbutylacetonicum]|uniref:Transcriptional repressor, CopY family n=2 Tax=Clostridium saccharoperbutylacetonicum TaxID=36745 RepID=M1MTQ3_9CLOT|nr:transcriptional repressor, CopY family [Clostridium saccharoperbutylacetonicum N1-4(HMT)]NRT64363.1 putative transcriptional regulator [Clostridium saccharoperbutylacetonicum]NSB27732.1 putative transcriptional regulator [Clostridium saccharoperbutylacetonicum]NSB41219.1 putative transcriptional regulator [Clostridium saccharoperbutylacetonicum]
MEIMKIIWNKNRQVTTADILEELPKENSWKITTVMTLISRLTDKGILKVAKLGKLNNYSAKITEEEYKAIQADNFLEDMHNGSVKNFIATLFNNKKISKEDISDLKKWLKDV